MLDVHEPIIDVPILLVNRFSDASFIENIGMSIGTRVKAARKKAGLTQKELAAKAGMKQSTLSELETGESAGTTSIASLANALGVNALWLETGDGPSTKGAVDDLVSQIAKLTPAQRQVIKAVIASYTGGVVAGEPESQSVVAQSPGTFLIDATQPERDLLEEYRLATDSGKEFIRVAAQSAKKRSTPTAIRHENQRHSG